MKTKFNVILTLLLALVVQISFAQEKKISGTVSDKSEVLPGVGVVIKGTTKGTQTNFDGKYSIKAKIGDVLSFSYLGYTTVEKKVGLSNTINVILSGDENVLDEIVVTGIGIKRKPKELTSSVVSLGGDQLTKTKSVNAVTGVIGKVSGLQINTISNGVNPSTRITLRGNRSLLGNNEALIVIDGATASRNAIDRINPDDIASMTILKGSKSAALYGTDAANGVIVITTKKGKGKLSVNYSSTLQFESVAYLPKIQDQFGVGGFPDGQLLPLENVNWGPRYDGRLVDASETLDDGEVWKVPFTPIKNRNRDFFDTGVTIRHGISIGGGDDVSDILFSLDQVNTSGVVPKDKYNRTNLRFKASRKYKKLTIGANLSFFRSHSNTVSSAAGRQGRPVYWNLLNTPLHIPLDQMKNWRDGKFTRNEVSYFRFYENPYFILDTQREKNDINQFNIVTNLDYKITDWLNLSMISNYSFTSGTFKRELGAFEYAFKLQKVYANMDSNGASTFDQISEGFRFNNDLLLTFNKKISEDFSTKLIAGANIFIRKSNSIALGGNNLIVPDFYNVSTRKGKYTTTSGQSTSQKRGQAVYADFTLGFRDYLYLNITGRNDWTSTLSSQNRSFFYPSYGLSFVPTDAFPELKSTNGLSYLKASISYAKTGNGATPYQANDIFYAPTGFPYDTAAGLSQTSRPSDPNLSPEFTTSIETGIDFGLFKNRITGSVNAYKTNTTDQIIGVNTSLASGASVYVTNIGDVENKGLEFDLNTTVIQKKDLKWSIGANLALYKSKVKELFDGVKEITIGSVTGVDVIAAVGQPFPLLKTTSWLRDPQGRVVVGDNGDPIKDTNNQIQGQTAPDKILGLTTTLNYKNFSLYVAADYRTGHVFYNGVVNALEFTGLTQHSVTSGRQPFVYPNSSYSDGNGGFIANTNRLTSSAGNTFWGTTYNDVKENYITDASVWKIREIALSYKFNEDLLKKVGISNLSLSLYGRNLFTFRPADNVYTDPEFNINTSTDNFVGVGSQAQTPPTRQYGLTLNVKF